MQPVLTSFCAFHNDTILHTAFERLNSVQVIRILFVYLLIRVGCMPPHDKRGRHNTTGAIVWPVPLFSNSKNKRPKQDMYIIYDTRHSWSTNPGSVASQATTPAAGRRCIPSLHFEYDKPCAPCLLTSSESSVPTLPTRHLLGGGSKF